MVNGPSFKWQKRSCLRLALTAAHAAALPAPRSVCSALLTGCGMSALSPVGHSGLPAIAYFELRHVRDDLLHPPALIRSPRKLRLQESCELFPCLPNIRPATWVAHSNGQGREIPMMEKRGSKSPERRRRWLRKGGHGSRILWRSVAPKLVRTVASLDHSQQEARTR